MEGSLACTGAVARARGAGEHLMQATEGAVAAAELRRAPRRQLVGVCIDVWPALTTRAWRWTQMRRGGHGGSCEGKCYQLKASLQVEGEERCE